MENTTGQERSLKPEYRPLHTVLSKVQEIRERQELQDQLNRDMLTALRRYTVMDALSFCGYASALIVLGFTIYWYTQNTCDSHTPYLVFGILALLILLVLSLLSGNKAELARKSISDSRRMQKANQEEYARLNATEELPEPVNPKAGRSQATLSVCLCGLLVLATAAGCLVGNVLIERQAEQWIYTQYEQALESFHEGQYRSACEELAYPVAKGYAPAQELYDLSDVMVDFYPPWPEDRIDPLKKIISGPYSEFTRGEAQQLLDGIYEQLYEEALENLNSRYYSLAAGNLYYLKDDNYKDSVAYYHYSKALTYGKEYDFANAKSSVTKGLQSTQSQSVKSYGRDVQTAILKAETEWNEKGLPALRSKLPYVGMRERFINDTKLGRYESKSTSYGSLGSSKTTYTFHYGNYIYIVTCEDGAVTSWRSEKKVTVRKKSSTKSSTKKKTSDPFDAGSYAHPDDFYDWYEDDFWDYEDAEDYWEEYG